MMMDNLSELVTIGKQHFDHREYRQAENYFRKVLERTDRYADVLNMMGVIHHSDGRFSSAIDFFKKALTVNPRYTEAIMNLAVIYNDLGEYRESRKLYEFLKKSPKMKGVTIEPVLRGKLSNLHSSIGDIYRSAGVHSLAIDEYSKALELNPTYVDIRTKLGQTLREAGQLQKALKELKDVLKKVDNYTPARLQLGLTYYALGKTNDAKKEWQTILDDDPQNDYAKMYVRLVEAIASKAHKNSKSKSSKK